MREMRVAGVLKSAVPRLHPLPGLRSQTIPPGEINHQTFRYEFQ
jgi:hypothetical protein